MSQDSEEIKEKALKEGVPIIKDEGLAFLLNLIREKGCKRILELGTAVGYSSIAMAKRDPAIRIDPIERNKEMYDQAIINFEREGLEKQIRAYFMPIEEFKSDNKYDLIFVDAAKAQYGRYLEMFLDNLQQDGMMVFDNMIFHGLVYETGEIPSRSLRGLVRKIIKFRDFVHNDKRFDIIEFDNIGDGILVLTRRKSGT